MRVLWRRIKRHGKAAGKWVTENKLAVAVLGPLLSALILAVVLGRNAPATINNTQELHLPAPYAPSEASTRRLRPAAFVGPRSETPTDLCLYAEAAVFDYSDDRYESYEDKVDVGAGDDIGFTVSTFNMEAPPKGGVLTNVSLVITVPKGERRMMSIGVAANADNIDATSDYDHSDQVVLRSDEPFSVTAVRGFQVSENEAGGRKAPQWGRYQFLPQRAITVEEYETETRYTIRPSLDGSLGPSRQEDFQLLFNATIK